MNCARQCSMVWYGRKEEVMVWSRLPDWRIRVGMELLGQLKKFEPNFWRHLATFANLSHLLATLVQLLRTFGNFWWLLAAFCNFWRVLATFGHIWQLLSRIFGNFWVQPLSTYFGRPDFTIYTSVLSVQRYVWKRLDHNWSTLGNNNYHFSNKHVSWKNNSIGKLHSTFKKL